MKKIEQLKKLLNNPHISEEMKKKTREAIERLEGDSKKPAEKKESWKSDSEDRWYDLADMISGGEDPEATKIWNGLSAKEKEEFIKYMHELDTDFSNAGNWEDGKAPTLKDSRENVLYLMGDSNKVIEKAKAKKVTRKGKGVKSLLKDKPKKGGTPDNCDEILANLKKKKAQSKKSNKKAAVKAEIKEKAHSKYPELDNLIEGLANEVSSKINTITKKVESKMPYKAQYVLEELIKELQSRV